MTAMFYTILLYLALPLLVPWHLYRALSRGRKAALAERFGFPLPERLAAVSGQGAIWVHAVSVGETIAAVPLLKALKERWPDRRILVTNGTETGRGVAEGLAGVDAVCYFPFDYPFAVARLLDMVRPTLVVIVETEIWPNFLRTARGRGIPVLLANGRISDRSFGRYLRLNWFFRPVLDHFAAFCMQSAVDAERIVAMGAEPGKVHVTSNLKYDVPARTVTAGERRELREQYRIPAELLVMTAGSTHQGEEEAVLAAYRCQLQAHGSLFLVLVPRHPERCGAVAEFLKREGVVFTRRSQLADVPGRFNPGEVLLVDTIGELMKFYALAELVFVGGSLVPTGGHNILEPASLGIPVLFGPHMGNFREIAAFVTEGGGGMQVSDAAGLTVALGELLGDDGRRRAMGRNGARLLDANAGATGRHLRVIGSFLESTG
jgi:3-deoxy-D-manno-octulosonic-acid transferase